MPEAVRIVGIEGGHFSRPPGTVPFGINICPDGTLRLGNVPDGNEWNGFPIILRARDLNREIHLEDSSGRLALSWSSSEDHAAQPTNLARADDPVSPPPLYKQTILEEVPHSPIRQKPPLVYLGDQSCRIPSCGPPSQHNRQHLLLGRPLEPHGSDQLSLILLRGTNGRLS